MLLEKSTPRKIIFSFWRPSWISQLAISYANLCRQFQKLQTMPNILVYGTSCSIWEFGLPLEIVAFLAHSHPTTNERKDKNVPFQLHSIRQQLSMRRVVVYLLYQL